MSHLDKNQNVFKKIEEQEMVARQFGFYWETMEQLTEQIQSECLEIKEAMQKNDHSHLEEEIGDLLQAAISLAIFCEINPEKALLKSIEKFQKRYDRLVALARQDGRENLQNEKMEVLMSYWKRAKKMTSP
jgi:tetrapyrrole methylase family protein/MazG family protein